MTNLDAKEILRREYLRVVDRLGEVDPVQNPTLYQELLSMIESLGWMSNTHQAGGAPADEATPVHPTVDEIIAEVKAEKPEPSVEEYAPPVMNNPEPVEEPKTDTPALTKEVVRAALAKARKSGVNVTELLGELGYDNFSAVPAAKYGEIMERIG